MSPPDWMTAPAEREPAAGTADQAATKRVPFVFISGSITEESDSEIAAYDFRPKNGVLIVEVI